MKLLTILMVLGLGTSISAVVTAQAPAPHGTAPAPATQPPPQGQQQPQGQPPPGYAASPGATANESKIAGVQSRDIATLDDPNSPEEKADTTYRFIGARFRYIIIPKFYMGIFGDGGATVGVPAFGPEFTIRKNGFEYVMSVMYASYAMDPTPFKAKTDGNDAWEIVESSMKSLYLMSDFLWSAEMSPKFSFIYGGGVGLGIVFGDIHRQQAYPTGDPNNPDSYVPCTAQGVPNAMYCGKDNDHYGDYSEPSWANGGSKPLIFPWMSLQTGFRFKPTKQFMTRVDVGWNILNGPFFGLALNYGLL
jgi:hypothetical protein